MSGGRKDRLRWGYAGVLEALRSADPSAARVVEAYVDDLRSESAKRRIRVRDLEAELRGGDCG